jgi:hypothetical protein
MSKLLPDLLTGMITVVRKSANRPSQKTTPGSNDSRLIRHGAQNVLSRPWPKAPDHVPSVLR